MTLCRHADMHIHAYKHTQIDAFRSIVSDITDAQLSIYIACAYNRHILKCTMFATQ